MGAVDYVFKPFEPDVLRAKVAAFIEMSRNVTRLQDEITHRKATEARLDASRGLLESIGQALMMFIADGAPAAALDHVLRNMLAMTDSEYGFIGEILRSTKGEPYLKYHAVSMAGRHLYKRQGHRRLRIPFSGRCPYERALCHDRTQRKAFAC